MRAHPLTFGVVLFLASELMFFAGLFAAYFNLRVGAAPGAWPPSGVRLDVGSASLGTGFLALSEGLLFLAARALRRKRHTAARRWVWSAWGCGAAFAAIAAFGYAHNGFSVASGAYGSVYYTLTGFHLLHVLVGMLLLLGAVVSMRAPVMQAGDHSAMHALSYYWHFVFLVWLGVFATIYWVR